MANPKPLDAYRKRLYMSITEFAEYLGVSLRTLYRVYNGEPMRFSTMRRIAEKLGVHPSEIAEFVQNGGDEDDEDDEDEGQD